MPNLLKFSAIFCGLSILSFTASSSESDLIIPKVNEEIVLDGELNEPFWANATKVELGYETRPAENQTAKVKTTAYIVENGSSILLAFVAEDPNPEAILASLKDRDTIWADDMVGFKIDTFNDKRKAYNFFVNPLGIQMDSVEDDVTSREDISWNAIWYSEGKLTDSGYQVEIEIPFKVLRFPNTQGKKDWGIDFMRFYPRDYQYRLAYNQVDRAQSCSVCQIGSISGFENIESGNNLEVTPYASGQRSDSRDPVNAPEWQNGDFEFDGGVDVRWGVTDNSVLNATINPDFSQVESDAIQLDVNQTFALFFQERRPFFLEGADYFSSNGFNLLHTRNIADPDWGVKYTGKTDSHSYAVLAASDNSTSFLLPGAQSSNLASSENFESNAFAGRYSYDIGEKSQIGGMITHRSGDDYSNTVASVDGKYYITDEDVIRYQLIHTDTDDSDELVSTSEEYDTGFGYALSYHHNGRNWSWRASRQELDEDFRADLGFINQSGLSRDVLGAGYTWHGEEGDSFDRIHLGGDVDQTYDYTGQKLEQESEFWVNMNGPYQSWIGFGAGVRDAWFSNETVNIPDADCARDDGGCWFDQNYFWLGANFRPINSLQLGINYNNADAVDFITGINAAKRMGYNFWGNWQVTRHWFFSASYNVTELDGDAGNLFKSDIVNLNSTYQFDKYQYLRLTVRYRDVDFNQNVVTDRSDNKAIGRQLLYGYKVNPRTVFFLGYSDGGFEDNTVSQFERTGRSIFSKFSYAFQM